MVRKLSISPGDSDLSLPTKDEEREVKEADLLSSNFPQWSSRFKCLEAYVCALSSFTCMMDQCRVIQRYGSITFLIYICLTITFGIPVVFVEILLGRYVMGNVTRAWSMCPFGKGLLLCLLVSTTYALVINQVCTTYLIKYLFSFYGGHMPWDNCRKPWARENCFVIVNNGTNLINCFRKNSAAYCHNLTWETTGTQFWKYSIGNKTDVKEVCLTAVYSVVTSFFVILINLKGHRSCEKMFTILVIVPFAVLLVLTFVAFISLEAGSGLIKSVKFNIGAIFCVHMWFDVLLNFITSLTLGTLTISYVSSHGKFSDNIFIDTLVAIFTIFISPSFLALPVTSVFEATRILYNDSPLSFVLKKMQMHDGMISVFIIISEGFMSYPTPKVLWAFLFYLQVILLSIGTQAIMSLALSESIGVILNQNNFICNSVIVGVVIFALSTPYFFYEFNLKGGFSSFLLTIILSYSITIQYIYGYKKFLEDIHFMMGYLPSILFFRILWRTVVPLLGIVVLYKLYISIYFRLPTKDYIYITISVVLYVLVALIQIIRAARKGDIRTAFLPDPNWGPDNALLKMSRVVFDTRTATKEFSYRRELFRKHLMKPPNFADQNIVQII